MGFARHAESGSIEGGGWRFFFVVVAAVVTEQKSISLHVDHCNSESSFFSKVRFWCAGASETLRCLLVRVYLDNCPVPMAQTTGHIFQTIA